MEYCICVLQCITAGVCFFFFLYYHVATMLLLFIIFKCTIFKCPLCSLHEMTWISYHYYYYFFECWKLYYQNKNKKLLSFQKGPSWVWFISLCVFCFLSIIFFFCVLLGSGGCEIDWDNTAVVSRLSRDHLSRLFKKKKEVISVFFVAWGSSGDKEVRMWVAVRRTDLWIHTTLKKERKKQKHQRFRPHMQQYSHTTM